MQKPVKLITENPELLLYLDGKLHITVLGGIKLTGFDRLKVTLKLVCTDKKQNIFRHSFSVGGHGDVSQGGRIMPDP